MTTTTTNKVLTRIAKIRRESMVIHRLAGKMPIVTLGEHCDLLEALLAEREAVSHHCQVEGCVRCEAIKPADAALARFAEENIGKGRS
jgi:hypothetical protein